MPNASAGFCGCRSPLPEAFGPISACPSSTVIAVLHVIASRSGTSARSVTGILLAVAADFTVPKLRIEWVRAPALPVSMTKAEIKGRIVGLEGRTDGGYLYWLGRLAIGIASSTKATTRSRNAVGCAASSQQRNTAQPGQPIYLTHSTRNGRPATRSTGVRGATDRLIGPASARSMHDIFTPAPKPSEATAAHSGSRSNPAIGSRVRFRQYRRIRPTSRP
jgi:hypothetical protein